LCCKKDEIEKTPGDVDIVLTTSEFIELMKTFHVHWSHLKESNFDSLLGESTGAASLFGVTGGVMEAALRYAHEQITHEKLGNITYTQLRGLDSV
jgi:NADH-quinone oxidoreductase subunit G